MSPLESEVIKAYIESGRLVEYAKDALKSAEVANEHIHVIYDAMFKGDTDEEED